MYRIAQVFLFAGLVMFAVASHAAGEPQKQRIVLTDKTTLIGRVVEMKDGVYTVETDTLGRLKIEAARVVEISSLHQALTGTQKESSSDSAVDALRPKVNPTAAPEKIKILDGEKKQQTSGPRQENASVTGSDDLTRQQEEVNSRVRSMTMDGDFLDSMMDLGDSTAMTEVMQDPEIMDAISRNDYDFLMNNEKMKSLMDSQEIKSLLGDVQP
ncbi:MAG TPA: hypothetical protein PKI71_09405 [Candidatus Rifleibacterium sp.]|nr:hypothetical protein [Candidatus Rifleibacterium sp.]